MNTDVDTDKRQQKRIESLKSGDVQSDGQIVEGKKSGEANDSERPSVAWKWERKVSS